MVALYYLINYIIKNPLHSQGKVKKGDEPEDLVQDPYCKTYIPKTTSLKKKIGGKIYHFCSEDCLNHFIEKNKV